LKKISEAVSGIINEGGVALLPTDTVYGLFVKALDKEAVKQVYAMKGRDFNKPLQVFFSSVDEIKKYALLSGKTEKKVRAMLPGPYTVILKLKAAKKNTFSFLGNGTIGARVVKVKCVNEVIKKCGPLAATSANVSGAGSPVKFKDIDPAIAGQCDITIKDDKIITGRASTIVDTIKGIDIIR